MSTATTLMTHEEFVALPDDGIERQLIGGVVWETGMTIRNHRHSRIQMVLGHFLLKWIESQAGPRGAVYGGEVGCRLRRNPDSSVGIDVAYLSPEQYAKQPQDATYLEVLPTLVVEILSPSDKHEDIVAKVNEYLEVGIPLVWVVDPSFRTVAVHRPGAEPEYFNVNHELLGDPHLPGLRIPVASIFAN